MNVTIDDTSPQIQYYSQSNGWIVNHAPDTQIKNYFQQTFCGTKTDGDYMQFTFNGTAIWVYGANRPNHGIYSTQLDGGSISYQAGYQDPAIFQQVIFAASGLSDRNEHVVTITNLPSQTKPPGNGTYDWWLDIDYIVVTTSTSGKVFTTSYDDTSSAVTYSGTGWSSGVPNKDYYNTTAHLTKVPGDSMQLSFNGSSIQVFGGLMSDHGNYSVSLDGQPPDVYNGTFFRLQPQTVLYTASGLKDGPHILNMINFGQGPNGANFLDFDYAVVNSTIDPTKSGTTGTNLTSTTTLTPGLTPSAGDHRQGGSDLNVAAVAGGAAGGAVALVLIGLVVWFWRKRAAGKKEDSHLGYAMRRSSDPIDLNGAEVKPFTHPDMAYQHPLMMRSASSSAGEQDYGREGVEYAPTHELPYIPSATARAHDHQTSPFLAGLPPPPPSNATSYPRSDRRTSSDGVSTRGLPNPFGASHTTLAQCDGVEGIGETQQRNPHRPVPGASDVSHGDGPSTTGGRRKGQSTTLPFTARPPSSIQNSGPVDIAAEPLTRQSPSSVTGSPSPTLTGPRGRMYVPGREVDMGPLPVNVENDDHDERYGPLPPDYAQATEPLPGQRE
ncbi:hypothetical protein IAU60_004748 [Kwoniella sp. DSM 27419]